MARKSRIAIRSLMLAGCASLALSGAAFAQNAPAVHFDIPAEDLGAALNQLAQQSRQEIVFDAALARGKHAPAVRGDMTPSQALDAVLKGSGLTYRVTAAGSIVVGLAQAADAAAVQEVVVTAQKRSESIQRVPMSIQALDTKMLTQLNVTEFNDYVKYMPSVTFQPTGEGPGNSQIYMRGVTSGANGNHSGSLPTVGTYLDEMPITTIGGTLDVHIYDIARIEVLPGPQGTLYGASSEAGTLRIITNKPSTSGFSAGYDAQVNHVDHGGIGHTLEGFVNVPVTSNVAVRLVGWDQHDAGYIDNVYGTRKYATSGATINNAGLVKKNFNDVDTIGGRAALKWDVNDSWTVEPTIMFQDMKANGVFGYQPDVGYLQVQHFGQDVDEDRWGAAALAIHGKIGKYDLTYAGGYFLRANDAKNDYTDYSVFYDKVYGSGPYWVDSANNILPTPNMEIVGRDRFSKSSHELRLASPSSDRFRFIVGLFEQRQTHWVDQSYNIAGFSSQLAIPGSPNTLWLTDEMRVDRDGAAFGEVSYDITPKLTVTGGIRGYEYKNSLEGFYGVSSAYQKFNPYAPGSGMGYDSVHNILNVNCKSMDRYRGGPCINLNSAVSGSGETHKFNATYKIDPSKLVYLTYSTGFRPGGVNRVGSFVPYGADTLDNYEAGWKTSWLDHRVRFNGAIYYESWNNFQYSFKGPSGLTVIENGPKAGILGAESNVDWRATDHLTLSFNGSYNRAKMIGALCRSLGPCPAPGNKLLAPAGQMLPFTPAFKGNLTARYSFMLGDWNGHAQGGLLYQTKEELGLRTSDVVNYGDVPAYATADFSFGAERGNLSLELFVKNAFDAREAANRQLACDICGTKGTGMPRGFYVLPIQPMTVGLRLGQKF